MGILHTHSEEKPALLDKLQSVVATCRFWANIEYWKERGADSSMHLYVPEVDPVTEEERHDRGDHNHFFHRPKPKFRSLQRCPLGSRKWLKVSARVKEANFQNFWFRDVQIKLFKSFHLKKIPQKIFFQCKVIGRWSLLHVNCFNYPLTSPVILG